LNFNKADAEALLRNEAALAEKGDFDPEWKQVVEDFSEMSRGSPQTHIAFLGTAMLAKALNLDVDVFAIKAGTSDHRAYSVRSLGHGALVPHAVELGINLGVTGREPLNNQPYFRSDRMSPDIVVHSTARPLIGELCRILERLDKINDADAARAAFRAFIHVRRQYTPGYQEILATDEDVSTERLIRSIAEFVKENSEGGKRAQAVVAGLMDLFAGPDRVVTSRINDPDRHLPGDVGVRSTNEPDKWERVFEVRDKLVPQSDVYHFASKALTDGVEEAGIVAVDEQQEDIPFDEPRAWALERGLALSLFRGWNDFVSQVVFWSEQPQRDATKIALSLIYERLIEVEVSEDGAKLWRQLSAKGN